MKKFVSLLLILVLLFALATAAFAVTSPERQNTDIDADDDPINSPQTGDSGMIVWTIAAMVLAVGVVAFCGRKLVGEK